MKTNLKAFTLLELIIGIAVLAILASMATSAFVDLQRHALDVTEATTANAIRAGLRLEWTRRTVEGTSPVWPTDNPMNYLENPPPSRVLESGEPLPNAETTDGITWHIAWKPYSPRTHCSIYCPHVTTGGGGYGIEWYYCFKPCTLDARPFPAGTFISYKVLHNSHNYLAGH